MGATTNEAEGYTVIAMVGEKRVGTIVGTQDDYYIVRRSFGRGSYPVPRKNATVVRERRLVRMNLSPRDLFSAPKVRSNGELDPATHDHYGG